VRAQLRARFCCAAYLAFIIGTVCMAATLSSIGIANFSSSCISEVYLNPIAEFGYVLIGIDKDIVITNDSLDRMATPG
jgi:hypothetical protein